MRDSSANARLIRNVAKTQFLIEAKSRQGPKRDIEKIVEISTLILRNNRKGVHSLSREEIMADLPNIKEDVLEDYLKFLSENPPGDEPFLKRRKRKTDPHKRGPLPYEYTFNYYWLRDKPMTINELNASIILEE